MDREKILKLAREHDLHCFGNITEYSLFGEAIVEFSDAIRAATKEEDARICDERSAVYEKAKKTHPPRSIEYARCGAKAYACFNDAAAIRASK